MSIEYTKDVEDPPRYIDLAFFEEIVENALHETNLKIEKVLFTMGCATGENYCSRIYRAKVEYKRLEDGKPSGTLSVIIKSMPVNKSTEFLLDMKAFLKEKTIYNNVLPRLELFLENGIRFAPRLYHSLKVPVRTLIFEDLSTQDFVVANRQTGLDMSHCVLVMQRLAEFHATSMVLHKKDPEIMKCFNTGIIVESTMIDDDGMVMIIFGGYANALVERVSQWPGYESIAKKLQKYRDNLRQNLLRCSVPIPGELKVLNHGDAWVNNYLFKYDKQNKLLDMIFLDFQMSMWGSPGIDINYFFYTSLELSILKEKRADLLKEYYKTLTSALRRLNFKDIPTYEQILKEVRRREAYGFFANFAIYPTISVDKETSADNTLSAYEDEDFAKNRLRHIYASKNMENMMKYTLKYFDEMGIFD